MAWGLTRLRRAGRHRVAAVTASSALMVYAIACGPAFTVETAQSDAGGAGGQAASASQGSGSDGGSQASPSSGGGPAGGGDVELCLNGIDDDGDDLADCDDPDCGAYACVPASSADYAMARTAGDPCPASSIATTLAKCESCSCTGTGSCSLDIDFYADANCTQYLLSKTQPGCYNVGSGQVRWVRGTASPPANCQPPADAPPSTVGACVATSAGHCAGNNVCLPQEFAASPCVLASGAVARVAAPPSRPTRSPSTRSAAFRETDAPAWGQRVSKRAA